MRIELHPEVDAGRCGRGHTPRDAARLRARAGGNSAFTLLEVLLAIAIFAMVVTAIYTSWTAILRAAKIGGDAAAELQRSRIASRTVEDALVSVVMFGGSPALYSFNSDTSGDFAALSFVSRLPPSFPGSGYFGDQVVRRVEFTVEAAEGGGNQLVLRQIPLLQGRTTEEDEHKLVLAREINTFMVEFCYARGNTYEWVGEWLQTNQLPKLVRFALAFGKADASGKPKDVTVRTVSIPSVVVPRDSQQAAVGAGGPRGAPGTGQPGQPGFPGGGNPINDPRQRGMGPQDPRQSIDQRFGPPVRGGRP